MIFLFFIISLLQICCNLDLHNARQNLNIECNHNGLQMDFWHVTKQGKIEKENSQPTLAPHLLFIFIQTWVSLKTRFWVGKWLKLLKITKKKSAILLIDHILWRNNQQHQSLEGILYSICRMSVLRSENQIFGVGEAQNCC